MNSEDNPERSSLPWIKLTAIAALLAAVIAIVAFSFNYRTNLRDRRQQAEEPLNQAFHLLGGEEGKIAVPLEEPLPPVSSSRVATAEEKIRQALKFYPKSPRAHTYLGIVHTFREQYKLALADLERAKKFDPGYAEAYWYTTIVLCLRREYCEAIEAGKRAAALNQDDPRPQSNLGIALRKAGDLAGAEAAYRKATVIEPTFADAWEGLGYSLYLQGKLKEARNAYEQWVRHSRGSAEALYMVGVVLTELRLSEEAIDYLSRAKAMDTHFIRAHQLLALVLIERGRYAEAEVVLREAKSQDPQSAQLHLLKGMLHRRKGEFTAARRELQLATEGVPRDLEAWKELALALQNDNSRR